MVTTNCRELTGAGECTVPLSGNSMTELQRNVFKHAEKHHPDKVKTLTPQDQVNMIQRIQDIYNQKAMLTVNR